MGFSIYWDSGILQARFLWARRLPAVIAAGICALFLLQGAVRPLLFFVLPHSAEHAATRAKERANGELIRALGALTPPGAKIFLEGGDYLVRYAALRNLAFSHKDGVILLYAKNVPGLREWHPTALELENPDKLGVIAGGSPAVDVKAASSPEKLLESARRTGSDHLVVFAPGNLPLLQHAGEILWNNSHYVMLRLARDTQDGAL